MSHKRKNKGTRPFTHPHGDRNAPRPANEGGDAGATPADSAPVPGAAPEGWTATESPAAEPAEEPVRAEDEAGAFACPLSPDEVKKLWAERDSYLELARRERADFDNYRKRVQREMAGMKRESLAGFLKDFFGPLEDMHRVLQESAKEQSFDALIGGVRIMEENFWRVLAKAGVRKIAAKGETFDPTLHEAMAATPSADVPPNTVLEVYENGYKLDDFILRPARVIVSCAPAE